MSNTVRPRVPEQAVTEHRELFSAPQIVVGEASEYESGAVTAMHYVSALMAGEHASALRSDGAKYADLQLNAIPQADGTDEMAVSRHEAAITEFIGTLNRDRLRMYLYVFNMTPEMLMKRMRKYGQQMPAALFMDREEISDHYQSLYPDNVDVVFPEELWWGNLSLADWLTFLSHDEFRGLAMRFRCPHCIGEGGTFAEHTIGVTFAIDGDDPHIGVGTKSKSAGDAKNWNLLSDIKCAVSKIPGKPLMFESDLPEDHSFLNRVLDMRVADLMKLGFFTTGQVALRFAAESTTNLQVRRYAGRYSHAGEYRRDMEGFRQGLPEGLKLEVTSPMHLWKSSAAVEGGKTLLESAELINLLNTNAEFAQAFAEWCAAWQEFYVLPDSELDGPFEPTLIVADNGELEKILPEYEGLGIRELGFANGVNISRKVAGGKGLFPLLVVNTKGEILYFKVTR